MRTWQSSSNGDIIILRAKFIVIANEVKQSSYYSITAEILDYFVTTFLVMTWTEYVFQDSSPSFIATLAINVPTLDVYKSFRLSPSSSLSENNSLDCFPRQSALCSLASQNNRMGLLSLRTK